VSLKVSLLGSFGGLADYSANYPEVAMDCLHRIVFAEKETPYWWGLDEEIKTILRNGLASTGEAKQLAKTQAEEVQDHLLRLGRFQFRNLDPKPGDAGELG
jgi:hypothetical protein